MKHDVKNLGLADKGRNRTAWAGREMPVLLKIREDFAKHKPLKKVKIGACLHVTAETANLMVTLKAGGAGVALCASNPLSTQDEVAASLVADYKIPVFARRGESRKLYYKHLNQVLDSRPQITMDDGADLVSLLHGERQRQAKSIWGSSEETTTGVIRLKSLARQGRLKFPVVAVNDSKTKFMFDNRYGTGQSAIDGILRATNILLAGKRVAVAGYGWVGKGIAARARGMGAQVTICETDPIAALEAKMDGFQVMPMEHAASRAEIFITATGNKNVLDIPDFERMKDGCVLANAGHFDVEINVKGLKDISHHQIQVRPNLTEYVINGPSPSLPHEGGRKYSPPRAGGARGGGNKSIFLIAEGRLVNLASAEGHPAAVMDMSFAGQAKAAEFLVKNHRKLKKQVYALPEEVDREIARLKLEALGLKIDELTAGQRQYLASWQEGT